LKQSHCVIIAAPLRGRGDIRWSKRTIKPRQS